MVLNEDPHPLDFRLVRWGYRLLKRAWLYVDGYVFGVREPSHVAKVCWVAFLIVMLALFARLLISND